MDVTLLKYIQGGQKVRIIAWLLQELKRLILKWQRLPMIAK